MSAPETPRRPSSAELVAQVAVTALHRAPSEPEHTVTISTTAKHGSAADPEPKRMHTWEITVRGIDAEACGELAQSLDDGLSAKYAHELNGDTS